MQQMTKRADDVIEWNVHISVKTLPSRGSVYAGHHKRFLIAVT